MLHVVLLILKIIGCILLFVLAFVLLLTAVVLFVPIRYRLSGEAAREEKPSVRVIGKVYWLLHLLTIRFEWEGEEPRVTARILGIVVFPRRKKKKKGKRKKNGRPMKQDAKRSRSKDKAAEIEKYGEAEGTDQRGIVQKKAAETGQQESGRTAGRPEPDEPEVQRIYGGPEIGFEPSLPENPAEAGRKKKSIFEKWKRSIGNLRRKIKKMIAKLSHIPQRVSSIFRRILDMIKRVFYSGGKIRDFIENETNRRGIRSAYEGIKKTLRHVKPKKLRGYVHFGTGDSYSMGQVLILLSIFYGLYGENVEIVPEWEDKVIEGKLFLAGRIRVFTLALICIKLLTNKDIKELRANLEELKKEIGFSGLKGDD